MTERAAGQMPRGSFCHFILQGKISAELPETIPILRTAFPCRFFLSIFLCEHINERYDNKRQERRGREAANQHNAHGLSKFRTFTDVECYGQHIEQRRERCHQNWTQTQRTSLDNRLSNPNFAFSRLVRVIDQKDRVFRYKP